MQYTAGEARMNTLVRFSNGSLLMDVPVLANQQEQAYNISVRTQDVAKQTCWDLTGTNSERELGNFVLAVQLDDDDDNMHTSLSLTILGSIFQKTNPTKQ